MSNPTNEPPPLQQTDEATPGEPKVETNPEANKEVMYEIKTHNFILLLVGTLCGMGLGYIIWIFLRKDLVFWFVSAIGLLVAMIVEMKKYPQNVVRIWVSKNTESMLFAPRDWQEKAVQNGDFYVQSDIYDLDQNFVRTTAVYHDKRTFSLTVKERVVTRSRGLQNLTMSSPYAAAAVLVAVVIFALVKYLIQQDAGPNLSVFFVCILVLSPVLVFVGCIIEIELRKRRFFAFANARDIVTYIPLHSIGNIHRETIGSNHWRLLYVPDEQKYRKLRKILKWILLPFLVVFRVLTVVVTLTTYNGAFAIWFWECLAVIVLYLMQVQKDVTYVEPAMTLLWIAFVVNVFELWYCSKANGRLDSVFSGEHEVKKLELDSDTRLPKDKVRILFWFFCVSLFLIFVSAVAMTYTTHAIFQNVEFLNFDNTWQTSYKTYSKFIFCKSSSPQRRLIEMDAKSNTLKSKYSSDYAALCSSSIFHSTGLAVAFATIDWFLLLILVIYWHTYDKYQIRAKNNTNGRVWHGFTHFHIHTISSKVSRLGHFIGGGDAHSHSMSFFILPDDANKLQRYLTENVPWHEQLDPKLRSW